MSARLDPLRKARFTQVTSDSEGPITRFLQRFAGLFSAFGAGATGWSDSESRAEIELNTPDHSLSQVLRSTVGLLETSNQLGASAPQSPESSHEILEPVVDVFEEWDQVVVVAILPGVDPEKVHLELKEDLLVIRSDGMNASQRKEVALPAPFRPECMTRACRDGVLEVKLKLDRASAARFEPKSDEFLAVPSRQ